MFIESNGRVLNLSLFHGTNILKMRRSRETIFFERPNLLRLWYSLLYTVSS